MKNIRKIIAVVLTLVMALSLTSVFASAEENEMTVVVSLEGLTIGQGFYFAPTAYTLDEINALVAEKGYGPYTESNLTASMATLAAFIDNGIDLSGIAGWDSNLFIDSIKGIDNGNVNIPESITKASGISNSNQTGNDDDYLGSFDYSSFSGWMFLVNNEMAPVSASDYVFSKYPTSHDNTWVVRWAFSIYGWGVDLGGDGWGVFDPIDADFVDRDELYIAYANCDNASAKKEALKLMSTYLPSSDAINAAVENLNNPVEDDNPGESSDKCTHICHNTNKFMSFLWKIANFFNKLFGIKNTCACGAAHY